ncbi:hypothetical protein A8B78_01610 [Jannaschia sp. EhC01]|nr:hypothetical protein A8B78_01610 [Jannaschia sp. EhC01]
MIGTMGLISAVVTWLAPAGAQTFLMMEIALAIMLLLTIGLLCAKIRVSRFANKALQEAEKTLDDVSAQEAILRAVAQNANDGLVYQDMEARILWANPAYCRIMGRSLEEVIGRRPQEFCFPPDVKPDDEEIENFRFDPDSYEFHNLVRRPNMRKNGELFWHEFNLAVVEPRVGEKRVILVSRDVTPQVNREEELERARADLHHAAHHDALTGLHNRTAFLAATDAILRRPDPDARAIGLLYIDLDHFKAVNDTHGHSAGDRILVHVADAIRACVGPNDLSCRMGGDEFVVACPGVTDFDQLQHVADRIMECIRTPLEWEDTSLECGASIGIALSDGDETTAADLIRSADFALYEAKRPGSPRVARYDAVLHNRQEAENAMMEEFVDTLDNDGISFVYQPILDGRTGKVYSFEALARWHRSNGEVVPPDVFLRYASRLNRMADVDFAAIRATTSLVSDLRAQGFSIRGAFNTSSEALAHPDFMRRLDHEARRAGLDTQSLVAEVLETTFFGSDTTDSVAAARILELREKGFSVYLDDFGVGYAGLSHLSQLEVSGVKLDRSLIANVTHDRSARIITTSILRLCDELGVSTLAEGIEYAEQADFLMAHGCFRLQGFGIARPMDRDALIGMVAKGAPIVIAPERTVHALSA